MSYVGTGMINMGVWYCQTMHNSAICPSYNLVAPGRLSWQAGLKISRFSQVIRDSALLTAVRGLQPFCKPVVMELGCWRCKKT